jgi:hypothetical protein
VALKKVFTNMYWILPLATGFFVQIVKFFIYSIKEKRVSFPWLFSTGGMPSAHSAAVSCMSVITGHHFGFDSPIFGITLYFSLVIMYDAAGIRRAAGEHAELLNIIIEEMERNKAAGRQKLKELLGHSPLEVIVGSFIGIMLGIVFICVGWV